jgi:predicted anti-sigma-YlaC factor YlaD
VIAGTPGFARATNQVVNCDDWQAAIAALAAGESTPVDPRWVRAHLSGCATCRARHDELVLDATPSGDDQAGSVLANTVVAHARRIDRRAVHPLLRLALVGCAATLLVVHAPTLVLGDGHHGGEHVARHAAACPVAFAIGLVVVALRPSKARGLLPVIGALAAALLITAAVDIGRGITPIVAEVDHLAEVVGAILVWLTAHTLSRRAPLSPPRRPTLAPT